MIGLWVYVCVCFVEILDVMGLCSYYASSGAEGYHCLQ
jgi:hypothetical protein